MPAKYTGNTCKVAGCDQPRMMSKTGKQLTMCEEHQREYWRKYANRSNEERRATMAQRPAGRKPNKPKLEKEAKPSATSDAPPPIEVQPPEPPAPVQIATGCEGCIYHEVIEKLAAKDARIGELVAALERTRELERELFEQAPEPRAMPAQVRMAVAGERVYRGEAVVIDGTELLRLAVAGVEAPGLPGDGDLARLMHKSGGSGQMVLHPVEDYPDAG